EPPGAFSFLPELHRPLAAARGFLADPNSDSDANAGAFAITLADAATESAPMGRSHVVSWTAVRSHTCNRADGIRGHLVCDRWRARALRRAPDQRDERGRLAAGPGAGAED